MSRACRTYYWDSSVFCSFLNKEINRWEVVKDLLEEAHSGQSQIITSSFALVEVLKLKNQLPITEAQEAELKVFFEYPFIKIWNADREICERSRFFVWSHGLKPKDAVHLATAETASTLFDLKGLFSWDSDFTKLQQKGLVQFPLSSPYQREPGLRFYDEAREEEVDQEEVDF